MKLKSLVLAAAVSMAMGSAANASVVYDAWQLDTTGAGINATTTNIGHLNLSGGVGHVDQSLGADGLLNAGDTFTEFGAIFSISVTKENSVGPTDSGFPVNFNAPLAGLQLAFTGLTGSVLSVDGAGNVAYKFNQNAGSIVIKGTTDGVNFVDLATLAIANPSGGQLEPFLGGALANGTTDILAAVTNVGYVSNLFRDSAGNSLDSLVDAADATSSLQAFIHTQNTKIAGAVNLGVGADGYYHAKFDVNSDGSFNLARVPAPAPLALMGLGLLAMARVARNKKA